MIGGRFSEPGDFLFGFTEISIKVEIHDNGEDLSRRIGLFLTDNSVPPIHESNLGLSVSLFSAQTQLHFTSSWSSKEAASSCSMIILLE